MPRKIEIERARAKERREFAINLLLSIAKNRKVHPTVRRSCLDRIAVMEKWYPVEIYVGPNSGRDTPEVTDLDAQVEKMMEQLKGGDDAL